MKYFFDVWDEFSAACAAAHHVLILLDYDGTLTPIVSRPEDAILSSPVREILSSLAQKKSFSVGVITGRSIDEIKQLVNIKGIYYSGNHGLEIDGPGLEYRNTTAFTARTLIDDLAARFARELSDVSGVIIQNKGFSLSVHYRLVKPENEVAIAGIVRRITGPLQDKRKIRVFEGKKVWEIRPPMDWDKGKAVVLIGQKICAGLKLTRLLTVYLGDDTTDEDAFRVLHRPDGWSVYIGPENETSAAEFYLKSTNEVESFLRKLKDIK